MIDTPQDYLVVAGTLVVIGKSPDGDSVRFLADDASLPPTLSFGDRLRVSGDGTVQLRFDGVDAPELHYSGAEQPLGAEARDALLAHLGFLQLTYAETSPIVVTAEPTTVPAAVLSAMVEVNGRPVAVVFTGDAGVELAPASGERRTFDVDLLARSANAWLVTTGTAYPLLYTSTAYDLREALRASAACARDAGLGVWAADSTAAFSISDQAALGPGGTLVFPKLFRRATDYLRDPVGSLPDWLAATPDEDDLVRVAEAEPVPLHTLLQQAGDVVTVEADVLDLVFVER